MQKTLRGAAEASLIWKAIVIVGRRDAGYSPPSRAPGRGKGRGGRRRVMDWLGWVGGKGAVGHGGSDIRRDWVQ